MKRSHSNKSLLSTSFKLFTTSEKTISTTENYFSYNTTSTFIDKNLSQCQIIENIPLVTKEKLKSITIENHGRNTNFSKFTSCGRFNLIYSTGGRIASTDYKTNKIFFERVLEPIVHAQYLQPEEYIAILHPRLCIYNKDGVEVSTINLYGKNMTYLPYHYLLAVSQHNKLTYIDITTGKKVKEIDSKFSHILKQNKGIIYSTVNNKINLFSPNTNENNNESKNNNGNPIISILAHKNNIDTLEVNDNYIYSTANNILNIHDIRNTYKHVESTNIKYRAYTSSLSDNNVLALSHRNKIQTYYLNNTHNHSHTIENDNAIKDSDIINDNNTIENNKTHNHNNSTAIISPYLSGRIKNNISNLTFIPHEDILSIGHAKGIDSFIIPGSGNPNYSEYDNPFSENRREMKIRKLLEKIPIELIGIEQPFEIEERNEIKKEEIKEDKKKKILHRIFDE